QRQHRAPVGGGQVRVRRGERRQHREVEREVVRPLGAHGAQRVGDRLLAAADHARHEPGEVDQHGRAAGGHAHASAYASRVRRAASSQLSSEARSIARARRSGAPAGSSRSEASAAARASASVGSTSSAPSPATSAVADTEEVTTAAPAAMASSTGSPKPSAREGRSEEHTSELQSRENLVCRLLLEKKKRKR